MLETLFTGAGLHDAALFLNRMILGVFFLLARFRWVYDPSKQSPWFNTERHASLEHKLVHCGINPNTAYGWAWFVAVVEIAGALGVIVGLLTPLAALGLLLILIRATICTGCEKTMRQNPIDRIDVVSCYLWCPEPVYIVLAVVALALGAGAWSLDAVVMGWLQ